jgi:hypothetical protein
MGESVPKVVIGETTFWLPYRDRLPPLSAEERKELKADIAKRGIMTPIIFCRVLGNAMIQRNHSAFPCAREEDVVVIDGANRVEIASELGLRDEQVPMMRRGDYTTTRQEFDVLVDDLNLHRRHLTPEQRREYVAKVLKDKPQRSNRQVAAQTGTDHKTVGAVRVKLEATGEIPQLQGTEGRDGKVRPARQKAKPAARRNGTPRREPATSTLTAERAPWTQTSTLRGHVVPALFLELTYHLEHHLDPAVPSHHLAELARRLDPLLRAAGVRPRRVP